MGTILKCALSLSIWASIASGADPTILARQIENKRSKVLEFAYIRDAAQQLGVRAWLFGGTAAGYGHYVRNDLERDSATDPNRFDYDYTNMYKSTQDIDIVIDGTPQQARELGSLLRAKFPHLQGNKSAWEIRLLEGQIGDKQPLLNNKDFLNQNSDSNSTGLIELTDPKDGESVVRDIREWHSSSPPFLRDLAKGAITFYASNKHYETEFYKDGRNPEILGAIRFLTKAFQYDLKIDPKDLTKIKRIVDRFDPNGSDVENRYVRKWLLEKDNAKKLAINAKDVERAWRVMDEIGLRKKLIAIQGDTEKMFSLAWWLNKQPLKSFKIGKGSGKTANALKIGEVAHETDSFASLENITARFDGIPNIFSSRTGSAGERAVHGEGFYTKIGREGAVGNGRTIRFRLNPEAREGTDFKVIAGRKNYVLVLNKAAIEIIPESLNLSPAEYVQFILEGNEIDHSDLAIKERLLRRTLTKMNALTENEWSNIFSKIKKARSNSRVASAIEFLGTASKGMPHVQSFLSELFQRKSEEIKDAVITSGYCFGIPACKSELLNRIKEKPKSPSLDYRDPVIEKAVEHASHANLVDILKALQKSPNAILSERIAKIALKRRLDPEGDELIKKVIETFEPEGIQSVIGECLSQAVKSENADILRLAIEKSKGRSNTFLVSNLIKELAKNPAALDANRENLRKLIEMSRSEDLKILANEMDRFGGNLLIQPEFRLLVQSFIKYSPWSYSGGAGDQREGAAILKRLRDSKKLSEAEIERTARTLGITYTPASLGEALGIRAESALFSGSDGKILRRAMNMEMNEAREALNTAFGPLPKTAHELACEAVLRRL